MHIKIRLKKYMLFSVHTYEQMLIIIGSLLNVIIIID